MTGGQLDKYTHDLLNFKIQFHQMVPVRDFDLEFLQKAKESICCKLQDDIAVELGTEHEKPQWYTITILRRIMRICEANLADSVTDLLVALSSIFSDVVNGTLHKDMHSKAEEEVSLRYYYTSNDYIMIQEMPNSLLMNGTTGLRTWEASLALAEHLALNPGLVIAKKVLELGAGTGLVSLLCGRLGAESVLATDGSSLVVQALERTILQQARKAQIRTCSLNFGEQSRELKQNRDLVVAADVTYDDCILPSLVDTIEAIFTRNAAARVMFAATLRKQST